MIAYLNKEKGYKKVREVMSAAQNSGDSILMNEVNVGEVFYILFRKRGSENADYFLERILPTLPILTISNGFDDVIAAAKIKAEYPISYADCFAAATARRMDAAIMTGDPEFKKIEPIVAMDWINK